METIKRQGLSALRMFAIGACVLMLALAAVCANATTAQAATTWDKVIVNNGATVKVGGYYFKLDSKTYRLAYSAREKSGFKRSPMGNYSTFVHGKTAYYTSGGKLHRFNLGSGKKTALKSLGKDASGVGAVRGNYVYVNCAGEFTGTRGHEVYVKAYNTKTGKLSTAANGFWIEDAGGAYAVGRAHTITDVSPRERYVYKINGTKLSKVRQVAKYGYSCRYVGGKLYFSSSKDVGMKETSLMRANPDGSGVECLGTWKGSNIVVLLSYAEDSCIVSLDAKDYQFTYDTGEFAEVVR